MTLQEKCPDCGAEIGHPHGRECDVERCSVCRQQRITCDCTGHDPMRALSTGEWPHKQIALILEKMTHEYACMVVEAPYDATEEEIRDMWAKAFVPHVEEWGSDPLEDVEVEIVGVDEDDEEAPIADVVLVRGGDGTLEIEPTIVRRKLAQKIVANWNDDATAVAADAVKDILSSSPEIAEKLARVILCNDYWTEQIARAVLRMPSDHTEDYAGLLRALEDKETIERTKTG